LAEGSLNFEHIEVVYTNPSRVTLEGNNGGQVLIMVEFPYDYAKVQALKPLKECRAVSQAPNDQFLSSRNRSKVGIWVHLIRTSISRYHLTNNVVT